jgi:hypothetical protein
MRESGGIIARTQSCPLILKLRQQTTVQRHEIFPDVLSLPESLDGCKSTLATAAMRCESLHEVEVGQTRDGILAQH